MRILISISAKQVGELYHKTTKQALLKILRSGKLELSTGRGTSVEYKLTGEKNFFASLTRSRFGGYHFREGGRTSNYGSDVLITIDGSALSNREKIVPVDYWGNRGSTEDHAANGKEVEERLVSNKPEVMILKYIKRVDFIQNAVHGRIETYGMDKGKFILQENEQQARAIGSILLQLKKHSIKYGFFDNMKDWAMRRGEFSYTGPKEVSVVGKTEGYSRASKNSYKSVVALLEALNDKPYEQLSRDAQDICNQVYRYPNDVSAKFNDYDNYRKPEADPTMRAICMKITRVMQRRGFSTVNEAGKFMADKMDAHYKSETKRDNAEKASFAAPLIVEALTKPRNEWPEEAKLRVYDDPINVFSKITDSLSYAYDESVRLVKRVLDSDVPEVDELRRVMATLNLRTANDVVSSIYYEKVRNQ